MTNTPASKLIAPTITGSAGAWDAAPERYRLFSIVTEDPETGAQVTTDYTMPRAKHPGIVLEYLSMARKRGEEIAAAWLLERVLGEQGYSALIAEPDLTFETVIAINHLALQVLTGRAPAQGEPVDPEAEAAGGPFG